jgi:hypothetical protein
MKERHKMKKERHGSQRGGEANDARDAFCPTLGGRGEQSANDGEAKPDTDFARRSKWRREA